VGALFPILLATIHGVEGVDARLLASARSLGCRGWRLFAEVVLPAAAPSIVTGLAIGMGTCWFCLVSAEMISGQFGIGYYTWESYTVQNYANIIVGMLLIGVLGMGSWNSKSSPGAKAYFDAHVAGAKKEPDRWASGACWAGLEILTNAVKQHGLDRKAIRDYVANTTHKTIIGDIKFTGSENTATPGTVSQWQNGEFEVVWPPKVATAKLNASKPAWK